jgi:Fibronectin type III domain
MLILAASLLLSWLPVEGADHYDLCMSTTSMVSGSAPAKIFRSTQPSYTVPGLTVGTKYYFYVRTYCPYNTFLGNSNEIVYTAK